MKAFIFLALAMALPTTSMADQWSHASLRSDATMITVDFVARYVDTSSNKPSGHLEASPLYFNVRNPNFTGANRARIVVSNFSHCRSPYYDDGVRQMDYTVDLAFTGRGGFNGQLPGGLWVDSFSYDSKCSYWQHLSLVIDGEWVRDPINGSHDFQLDLGRAAIREFTRE